MQGPTRAGIIVLLLVMACSERERPAQPAPPGPTTEPAEWTLSATGFGAVHAGMSLDEARAALDQQLAAAASAECSYVTSTRLPEGVSLMVVNDTVRRIDVQSNTVTTDRGARIGDTETHIQSLYDTGLISLPHKYTSGHYLIVAVTDSSFRLVFETSPDTVTTMRSGMMPQVLWVEGCS
jgi:hypothetical protein